MATIAAPNEIARGTVRASSTPASTPSLKTLYISLFLVAFALRFGFALWKRTYVQAPGNILPFGAEICSIAQSIAEGRGFHSPFYIETGPTAWIAPGYPYMVAAVFKIFGMFSTASALVVIFLQCLMAAATAISIYALGIRCFGARVAFWSAWIWAVSPIFFRWPVSWIWDFTASALLVCTALVLTLDAAEKGTVRSWLFLGGIWGVIGLVNPAPLSIMPFSFLYAAYSNWQSGQKWLPRFASACGIFALLIVPWLVRNYVVFGHPVFLRSNYWFEFHMGNYHFSNGIGYSGTHPNNNPRVLAKYANIGELRFVANYKNEAFQFVRKYPKEFLALTAQRAAWFWDGSTLNFYGKPEWWVPWKFWPLSALGGLGLLFALTRRPRGWFLFAAALLVYPIPYYLAYPSVKYRHAIEPELLLLGVFFVSVLWGEIAARRSKSVAAAPR